MGWVEFTGWLQVRADQNKGPETAPDSWAGASSDPWWNEQRRKRNEQRGWQ